MSTLAKPEPGTRKRLAHIDAMRPVKQAAVISTHTLVFFAPLATSSAVVGLIMLTRFSRDAFLFVSACMLTYSYVNTSTFKYGHYFKRRFMSVGLPYIAWTIIYFFYTSLTPVTHFPYYSLAKSKVFSLDGLALLRSSLRDRLLPLVLLDRHYGVLRSVSFFPEIRTQVPDVALGHRGRGARLADRLRRVVGFATPLHPPLGSPTISPDHVVPDLFGRWRYRRPPLERDSRLDRLARAPDHRPHDLLRRSSRRFSVISTDMHGFRITCAPAPTSIRRRFCRSTSARYCASTYWVSIWSRRNEVSARVRRCGRVRTIPTASISPRCCGFLLASGSQSLPPAPRVGTRGAPGALLVYSLGFLFTAIVARTPLALAVTGRSRATWESFLPRARTNPGGTPR